MACQASLSLTISQSLPKFMSIKLVTPSNHLILCHPLLLPSIFPRIRVFSNESTIRIRWPKYWSFSFNTLATLCEDLTHIRWPKYWSFSFNISPSNEHPGLISFRMDWSDLLAVQGTLRVFFNFTIQKHQFFGTQPSLWINSHIHT